METKKKKTNFDFNFPTIKFESFKKKNQKALKKEKIKRFVEPQNLENNPSPPLPSAKEPFINTEFVNGPLWICKTFKKSKKKL